jgi:hypothetical protein
VDKTEAKIILQAYRPNGTDAADPQFAAALELARQDAELGAWFAEQQAFDRAITAKLRTAPVPADLRASILAGRKVVTPPPALWRRPAAWAAAIAAMLMLLLIPFALQHQGKPQFAEFKTDAVAFLDSLNRLDMTSKDSEAIREWLATHGGQRRFELPGNLARNPSIGCRVFDWKGQKVTLICFNITPKGGKFDEVHLLVLDEKTLRNAPTASTPAFEQKGSWKLASWKADGLTYVLAGSATSSKPIENFF